MIHVHIYMQAIESRWPHPVALDLHGPLAVCWCRQVGCAAPWSQAQGPPEEAGHHQGAAGRGRGLGAHVQVRIEWLLERGCVRGT
jgi:hypothetical protein